MIYDRNSAKEVTNSSASTPAAVPASGAASRAEIRRGRIIEAARTLFSENGFHNTGIAQVAKSSGVLVGQIYRDFANKEEIVAEIVERDLAPFLSDGALRDAVATGDDAAVLAWIAHFIRGDSANDVRLVAEIIAESSRNDRIAAIFQSVQERLRRSITAALQVLAPQQAKQRRRELLADVILTVAAGVFQRRLGQLGAVDPDLTATLIEMICRDIDALRDRPA